MNTLNLPAKLRQVKQHLGLRHLVGLKPLDGGDDWLEQTLARMPAERQNILLCQAIADVLPSQYSGSTEDAAVAAVEDLVREEAWAAVTEGRP
ncbi:hypothetical protein D9M73_276610 [compost metagenome]